MDDLEDAVAEWDKALHLREKINENQKIPGSPPGRGNLHKNKWTRGLEVINRGANLRSRWPWFVPSIITNFFVVLACH